MKTLTKDEKRVRIAEACGFNAVTGGWHNPDSFFCEDANPLWDIEDLPDYFHDMNSLMLTWESLTDEQKTVFAGHIRRFHDGMDMRVFAAFKQYGAEALGLTIGAWEEGQ